MISDGLLRVIIMYYLHLLNIQIKVTSRQTTCRIICARDKALESQRFKDFQVL